INTSGFAVGLFLLMTLYFSARSGKRLVVFAEMISAAIMIIMTGVSRYFITVRMQAIRASLSVPIDQIQLNDPRRVMFDHLHSYSVTVMGVAIVAALVAYVMAARGGNLKTNT